MIDHKVKLHKNHSFFEMIKHFLLNMVQFWCTYYKTMQRWTHIYF